MKTHRIGIIMNGVTGRMGTNQHLIRSIKAIIDQGGVKLSDSEVIMPDPVLVGRSEEKLKALAARTGAALETALEAAALAPQGAAILLKGSRGARMERFVEPLRSAFGSAAPAESAGVPAAR